MRNFYFRVDGSQSIGMGHVVRCLALAEYLSQFYKCIFIIQDIDAKTEKYVMSFGMSVITLPLNIAPSQELEILSGILDENSILVVDGYKFDKTYIKQIKSAVGLLIQIDDLNQGFYDADLIINHNLHAEDENYLIDREVSKVLKGIQYVIMRNKFESHINTHFAEGVLICLGGSDQKNVSLKLYEALRSFSPCSITIILGHSNVHGAIFDSLIEHDKKLFIKRSLSAQEMVEAISSHEFYFCTASVVSLEACSVGTKLIVGYTEENQKKMSYSIAEKGLGYNLENLYEQSSAELSLKIRPMMEKNFSPMTNNQRVLFDHKSKERIFHNIQKTWLVRHSFSTERFIFKVLKPSEVTLKYLSWFSDPKVIKNIEATKSMTDLDKLKSYVEERFNAPEAIMWGIYSNKNSEHIGNIKYEPLDWSKQIAVMGILIGEEEWRGKGVAQEAILSTAKVLKNLGIQKIYLGVSKDNLEAIRAYQKMGFLESTNEYLKVLSDGLEMVLNI